MNSESTGTPLRLLFVCVENSNRSQMAEAFARMLGGELVEAFSAGSKPSGQVNPRAIRSMLALGYDLEQHRSKALSELPAGQFAALVTMGCGDSCPSIPAVLREDWQIPDPKAMQPEQFDQVRDLIRERVSELLERVGSEN